MLVSVVITNPVRIPTFRADSASFLIHRDVYQRVTALETESFRQDAFHHAPAIDSSVKADPEDKHPDRRGKDQTTPNTGYSINDHSSDCRNTQDNRNERAAPL